MGKEEENRNTSDPEAYQYRFTTLPVHDSLKALEGRTDKIVVRKERVSKEETIKGIRTSISQIEKVYPWLLMREGFVEGELPEWQTSTESDLPARIGIAVHEADALFYVVSTGVKGPEIRDFLPNYKKKELERVIQAVDGVGDVDWGDSPAMKKSFIEAWEMYKNFSTPVKTVNMSLHGFGVENMGQNIDYSQIPNLDLYIEKLAHSWVRELGGEGNLSDLWEFQADSITQREVQIVLNLADPKLQLTGKLDSVTRRMPRGKVRAQVIDLKTGRSELNGVMEAEVHRRQIQTMRIMAERFTSEYLVHMEHLIPRESAFYISTEHESLAYEDRVHLAGYVYLNKETGEKRLEQAVMNNLERENFISWLTWYGRKIHKYGPEVRQLIKKRPSYKLSDIKLREGWDEFEVEEG